MLFHFPNTYFLHLSDCGENVSLLINFFFFDFCVEFLSLLSPHLLTLMVVAWVQRMAMSVMLCVCLCVCLHDKTKMAESTITKLSSIGTVSWYLTHQLIIGQKVKGQSHRVKKCKKAIEWPAWNYALCRVHSFYFVVSYSFSLQFLKSNQNVFISMWPRSYYPS